jgi:hypothetical protein
VELLGDRRRLVRPAFDGPGPAGDDEPALGQGTGTFFLTDDAVANAPAIPVILSYSPPVSVASAAILDIDGSEAWTVEARNTAGAIVASVSIASGDSGTGDGIATRWSLVRPAADIRFVRIVHTGAQVPVGWALENVGANVPSVNYCTAGTSTSGCQALLSATGTASASAPSGFVLSTANIEGSKDGLFFFGINGRQANTWGNGTSFRCIVPPTKRMPLMAGVGSPGACDGSFSLDANAQWCPTCPKPNHNPGVGTVGQVQLWYRDPLNTSNQTTSFSDAVEFTTVP